MKIKLALLGVMGLAIVNSLLPITISQSTDLTSEKQKLNTQVKGFIKGLKGGNGDADSNEKKEKIIEKAMSIIATLAVIAIGIGIIWIKLQSNTPARINNRSEQVQQWNRSLKNIDIELNQQAEKAFKDFNKTQQTQKESAQSIADRENMRAERREEYKKKLDELAQKHKKLDEQEKTVREQGGDIEEKLNAIEFMRKSWNKLERVYKQQLSNDLQETDTYNF